MAADQVGEILDLHGHVGIEGIEVVERDQPPGHVIFVVPGARIGFADIGLGHEILAEEADIGLGIFIADRRIGEEAQHLVRVDRPGDLLVDIGLDHRRAPIAVIARDEAGDADVVEQAGQRDLLAVPIVQRQPRALHDMLDIAEAPLEEVDQRRPLGHRRDARIGAHQELLPRRQRVEHVVPRRARILLARQIDRRADRGAFPPAPGSSGAPAHRRVAKARSCETLQGADSAGARHRSYGRDRL
ncbi:MAG: hypothetical protein WDN24_13620 [Sphingomonas sp.]